MNISKKGVRDTFSAPGTGLSYQTRRVQASARGLASIEGCCLRNVEITNFLKFGGLQPMFVITDRFCPGYLKLRTLHDPDPDRVVTGFPASSHGVLRAGVALEKCVWAERRCF